MFRDVPGCSGMFRNVPGCSMFRVLSTPVLDTVVYTKTRTRFSEKAILDVKTHFKQTETFQYTHFTFSHSQSVKTQAT